MIRAVLFGAGFVCLGLGIVGAVVPLLPATPFLLLAAFFFARSSHRFHTWIITNCLTGAYISNFRENRPMTAGQLVTTLAALWLSIAVTVAIARNWWIAAAMFTIASGVTAYLVTRNYRLLTRASGGG